MALTWTGSIQPFVPLSHAGIDVSSGTKFRDAAGPEAQLIPNIEGKPKPVRFKILLAASCIRP